MHTVLLSKVPRTAFFAAAQKAVKSLGIAVPQSVLVRADQVIK